MTEFRGVNFGLTCINPLLDIYVQLAYIYVMDFEWDENKRHSNLIKHQIDFADAVGVLFDDRAITVDDPDFFNEQRLITIGMDFKLQVLVVVNVQREGEIIRLISDRNANKQERRQYEG